MDQEAAVHVEPGVESATHRLSKQEGVVDGFEDCRGTVELFGVCAVWGDAFFGSGWSFCRRLTGRVIGCLKRDPFSTDCVLLVV